MSQTEFRRPQPVGEELSIDYVNTQRMFNVRAATSSYNILNRHRATMFSTVINSHDENNKPISILDIGCREGYALEIFCERFPESRVVGIDIVPEFIESALELCDAEAIVADAHKLPFKDQEFEAVYTSHTLEHCYDVDLAIKEAKRVCRGALFIAVPLEHEDETLKNESHFFSTMDPMVWAKKIESPDWVLVQLLFSCKSDMVMLWVRKNTLLYGKEPEYEAGT